MAVKNTWKIKNFGYWNKDVHTPCIRSPTLFLTCCAHMELYPRGVSGLDEHLVVRFCNIESDFPGGELIFIGTDGSTISKLRVNKKTNDNFLFSELGPKYEHLVDQIGKEIGNYFTVQFVLTSGKVQEQSMCTTIDVFQVIFEIDQSFIGGIKPGEEKLVLYKIFQNKEKLWESLYFKIYLLNRRMQLILERREGKDPLFIESCIKFLSNNETLLRVEETKHFFLDEQSWKLSDSMEVDEFVDKGNVLNVSLNIIRGDPKNKYNFLMDGEKGVNILHYNNSYYQKKCTFKDLKSSSSKQTCESVKKHPGDLMENGTDSNSMENSVTALSKELMYLCQEQDFSDLQIECGGVTFPVHKNILSARSPVFKCLLSSGMMEATSGKVDITDVDAPTFGRFLGFLYSGTVDDMEDQSAIKLYYSADKYQVPTLKRDCAEFLLANVSISNVCDILSLADKHQDGRLTSAAQDFLLNNYNRVTRSQEWKDFMISNSLLAAETLTLFAARDYVKKSDK